MLLSDERFRLHFRQWIGPSRINRRILVDAPSGLDRCVDEHRAGEDELLDLEFLKMLQEPLRAVHGDLFIEWEIVVGGEMDNGGNAVPVGDSDTLECAFDANLGGQIDAYAFCGRWRCVRRHPIEPNQREMARELVY